MLARMFFGFNWNSCYFFTIVCFLCQQSSYALCASWVDEEGSSMIGAASRVYPLSQAHHYELIRQSMPMFANKTLTICVVVREPFVNFDETNTDSSLQSKEEAEQDFNNYSGVAIEVIRRLQLLFKFRIKTLRPRDNQFGVWLPKEARWTGLVGMLVANESDIGVSALSITDSRSQVVDFTRAYYVETGAILLRIPEEVQNYFAIVEPFSNSVWCLLLMTILILIFLITIMTKLEEDQSRQHKLVKLLSRQKHHLSAAINQSHLDRRESKAIMEFERLKLIEDERRNNGRMQESSWLQRFYYSTTCVLNILLIRGELLETILF